MYLSYYGFDRAPFDPAPQPDSLFETSTHNEALAGLIYGILDRKGFIALLGEVGVGKTTVLRRALHYVAAQESQLLIVDITNPAIGPSALAARLHRAVDVEFDVARDADLAPLRDELARRAAAGQRLLLVIDEAQSVPSATLEFLRILSNLDGGGQPLIQVVFCGQPEFDETLHSPAQRALAQRIAVRTRIRPLKRSEIESYLEFKLTANGARPRQVMTRAAIGRIAAASGGFPRRVNIIADNALIAGFGADHKPIGVRDVADALRALDAPPRRPLRRLAWGFGMGAAAAVGGAVLLSSPGVLPRLAHDIAPAVKPAVAPFVPPIPTVAPAPSPVAPPPPPPLMALPRPPAALAPVPILAPPVVQPVPSRPDAVQTAGRPDPARPEPVQSEFTPSGEPPRPEVIAHEVKPGDTLTGIMRGHALPVDAPSLARLREINPEITNVDLLTPGQRILLPADAPSSSPSSSSPSARPTPRAP
jgi:general secretion pathway protein A